MASSSSSVRSRSNSPDTRLPTSAPSSPPDMEGDKEAELNPEYATVEEKAWLEEERKAQAENDQAEERRRKQTKRKKKPKAEDKNAKESLLDDLLNKSAAFSSILTKKTEALGRVGSGFDGKTLGEHDLVMAKQPNIMNGGTMRDYQLEGLTWMYEICSQGLSGILADEMGLGKTIQTISLIALLREQENYLGPHLIIAPLSTLSNWIEEFTKWTPSIPVLLYHGTPQQRRDLLQKKILANLKGGRPSDKFPVVCTSPEIILRDYNGLSKINWELLIIDEGHRMKNSESKLFQALKTTTSATRILITGTPLQNNLKELWSLLNFLLPQIFTDWEKFEAWFDFSGVQDEEGAEDFLADEKKQELVKKMHLILQPLLLRRVKADVEHMLPKKREYVLYAPMTKAQTDLYNVINDKKVDTRGYLEQQVVDRLTSSAKATIKPATKSKSTPKKTAKAKPKVKPMMVESDSEEDVPLVIRQRDQKTKPATSKSAFDQIMGKKKAKPGPAKRKAQGDFESDSKSAKTSKESTPASSIRGRTRNKQRSYKEDDASDEDALSDDEFEQKLAQELEDNEVRELHSELTEEEAEKAKIIELARREISTKKLGNPIMQLRLTCNSPHNFYNPWSADSGLPVDESIVTSSGKMLLLDRLLPYLFSKGHKVLIFSQFKTQLDILEDYARDLRAWNVCRIDGSVFQDDRRQQIKDFNENPDYKLFLLSTRAGGQGINLATADTVILFDSDWNPQQDLQAQDRAHRIGQVRPVVVFRLATKGTVEEDLLSSADGKRRLEKLVIKKGGYRTMGQKMEKEEDMTHEEMKTLLLKDGQVYKYSGDDRILSEEDLKILSDRSDAAYDRAEQGLGNAEGFKVVKTEANGFMA